MKFINIGEGAKIDGLTLRRNIMVTDDTSKVVFVDVGKDGEIINLDADGNQVLTPGAYKKYLAAEIEKDKCSLNEFLTQLDLIENDIDKARIKRQLKMVLEALELSVDNGRFDYNRALSTLRDACENLGYGVLSGIITTLIGYSYTGP